MAIRKKRSDRENQFYNDLAIRIRELREQAGLSRRDLASWIGIDVSALVYYELGRSRVPFFVLARMAFCLSFSLDDLARYLRE